jgi:hypothetical protein
MVGDWSKRLNFGMKRNCKIQGKMGCNGLGNRFSHLYFNHLQPDVANVLHPFPWHKILIT